MLPRSETEEKHEHKLCCEEKQTDVPQGPGSPSLRMLPISPSGDTPVRLGNRSMTETPGSYAVLPETSPLVVASTPATQESSRLELMGKPAEIIRASRTPSPPPSPEISIPASPPTEQPRFRASDPLPMSSVPLSSYLSDPNDPGVPKNQILSALRFLKSAALTDKGGARELSSPLKTISAPLPIAYLPGPEPNRSSPQPNRSSPPRRQEQPPRLERPCSDGLGRPGEAKRAVSTPNRARLPPAAVPRSASSIYPAQQRAMAPGGPRWKKQTLRAIGSLPVPGRKIRNNNTDRMIRKRIAKLRSMLGLGIREVVTINETGKTGVLMKISRRGTDLFLTIRLMCGTWLKNVEISKVTAKGTRANLELYLRLGDIMITRFGVAIVRGISRETGEISVEFRGPHKYNKRRRVPLRRFHTERSRSSPKIAIQLLRDVASGPNTGKKNRPKEYKLPGGRISYRRSTSEEARPSIRVVNDIPTNSAGNTPTRKRPTWDLGRVSEGNENDFPAPRPPRPAAPEKFTIHLSDVQQVLCAEDVLNRLEAKLQELANYRGLGSALASSVPGGHVIRLGQEAQNEANLLINFRGQSLQRPSAKEEDSDIDSEDSLPEGPDGLVESETVDSVPAPDNHPSFGSYDDQSLPLGEPTTIHSISGISGKEDSFGHFHIRIPKAPSTGLAWEARNIVKSAERVM